MFFAHDEYEMAVVGDIVICDELPAKVSTNKAHKLTKILCEADRYFDKQAGVLFTAPSLKRFRELANEGAEGSNSIRRIEGSVALLAK